MTNSNQKKLENGRAEQAYKDAEFAKSCQKATVQYNKDKSAKNFYKAEKYKSYAKDIPMMIKTNGLGATLAFVISKKAKEDKKKNKIPGTKDYPKNAYDLLYLQISNWIKNKRQYLLGEHKDKDLIEAVVSMESSQYRALTIEVLAYFGWLRRFAEGLIEGEDE